jgi:hypothetical protein
VHTNTSTDPRPRPPARPADGSRTAHRRSRLMAAGLLATLAASSVTAAVISTPASASTPRCDNWAMVVSGAQMPQAEIYLPAANGGWGTWRCLLRYGDHNPAVSELQRGLNWCYGTANRGANLGISLAVDGDLGPATKAALVKVQKHHKITADGVYGPQTAATIWHRGKVATPYGFYIACITTSDAGVR